MDRDHSAIAQEYCEDIVAGRRAACKKAKLACQRHLNDLKRAESGDLSFPYFFDSEKGNRACQFIELLPHVKGRWARKVPGQSNTIVLEPWQCFIVVSLFGWYCLPTDEQPFPIRRFIIAYIEVPRKNAKSTLAAGIAIYAFVADEEPGAEIYSAATGKDQARVVFDAARAMVLKTPDLIRRYGVNVRVLKMEVHSTDSEFVPLAADTKGLDGKNPHVAVIDELHAHKDRGVYDAMELGMDARDQPLLLAITTAGADQSGICFEQHGYLTDILEDNTETNERFFGIIYSIDPGDDWRDPAVWAKANPNLDVSVFTINLKPKADKAKNEPGARQGFLTKRLNVWTNVGERVIESEDWYACTDRELSLEDFHGETCVIALDLATRDDLAAKCYLFQKDGKYYYFWRYYVPDDSIQKQKHARYPAWHEKGFLIDTPGTVIDFDRIRDDITGIEADPAKGIEEDVPGDMHRFDVKEVVVDPWQATHLCTQLQNAGVEAVELRMTVANLSEPMKDFLADIQSGRMSHEGDPVSRWNSTNLLAKVDANDNFFPRKARPEAKIDGMVAAIMARARMMAEREERSVYEDRGVIFGSS